MADTFNKTHSQGITLDNEYGGLFFQDVNDRLTAENRIIGNSSNPPPFDRQMLLNIADSSQLQASDYEVDIEVGGLFRVTRLSDNTEVGTGLLSGSFPFSYNFDGLDLVFESGTFQEGDSFKLQPVRNGGRDFQSALVNAQGLAFSSPLLTDASITNIGSGAISSGEVLSLEDLNGDPLPILQNAGQMAPPLIVKFTSDTTYDILDNSNPGNPVQLDPPIRNKKFIVGVSNNLFGAEPGSTVISTHGDMAGLPVGRTPVSGPGAITNGYPAQGIRVHTPSDIPGQPGTTQTITTSMHQSAKDTASALSAIPGVSASALTYMELTNLNVTRAAPLQMTLNGRDLIEYDAGGLSLHVDVPDPTQIPANDFYDYIAERINSDEVLAASGIYAISGNDPVTGAIELRVHSSEGDDLAVTLNATIGESIDISDGEHTPTSLTIAAGGLTESLAVGGHMDVTLAETLTLNTFPPDSMIFGDTTAADFQKNNYLGIQASISGIPNTGDTFTLDFNVDGASDNRNALEMVNLATAKTIDNGLSSYNGAYGALVEKVGIETSSAKINADAAEQVLDQSISRRNSISGVNLDEEAAKLIQFEQMYSANTQVISVARDLFDRLLGAF